MSRPNLRLASFDGGGIRCFSQLLTMRDLMYKMRPHVHPDAVMRPCEYFDLIGGSDAGGVIVIMLVKLRMHVDEAIKEFGLICKEVYLKRIPVEVNSGPEESTISSQETRKLTPKERTEKLRACLHSILLRRELPPDWKLEDEGRDGRCLGFVVTASAYNVASKTYLRTYNVRNEHPSDVSVVDAALATCASPNEFLAVPIGPTEWELHDHIGAGLGANNPTRQVLEEAATFFPGADMDSVVILSLGSGDPGVLALTPSDKDDGLYKLMLEMLEDAEIQAQEVYRQMGHRKTYFRFSVEQGMQRECDPRAGELGWISSQTAAYLKHPRIKNLLNDFVLILVKESGLGAASSSNIVESVSVGPDSRTPNLIEAPLSMIPQKALPTAPPSYQSAVTNKPQSTSSKPNNPLLNGRKVVGNQLSKHTTALSSKLSRERDSLDEWALSRPAT